jgi:hypothetical protein
MRRLLAAGLGLVMATTIAVGPAQAASTQLVVGIGSAALVRYDGATPTRSTKTNLMLAQVGTEGIAIVGLAPRVIACAHFFNPDWVSGGAYIRTVAAGGREFRMLIFKAKVNHGPYRAGTTYSIIEDIPTNAGVGGNDAVCKFRNLPGGIVNLNHAASNGFIFTPVPT